MADGSALVEAASPAAEPLAVIEISEDGSWETKPLSAEELNAVAELGGDEEDAQPDFLATRGEGKLESVKIKHVARAHSSQYYVNCPVASVRPMVQESPPPKGGSEAIRVKAATVVSGAMVNGGGGCEGAESLKVERSTPGALMNGGLNGDVDVGCREVFSVVTEGAADGCGEELSAPVEEVVVGGGVADQDGGVVVTESIIENKEKTKSYWEEMMLAAAASGGSPPRAVPRASSAGDEAASPLGDGADGVPARVEGGSLSPAATGPKIVETVAKRAEGEGAADGDDEAEEEAADADDEEGGVTEGGGVTDADGVTGRGDVTEGVAASGRRAAWTRAETPAEMKIAMELREMREREEELRQLRHSLGLSRVEEGSSDAGDDGGVTSGRDDSALHSIPTTDEGNFSECGAEEKDGSEGKGRNDTMSPDMPSLESPAENGSYVHRRTQSMDSTSSGHSSASGGQRVGIEYPPRRRIIVKPFTSAEEDQNFREGELKDEYTMNLENQSNSAPFRGLKETPIEREIRIAREREDELRREKGLIQLTNQTQVARPEVAPRSPVPPVTPTVKGPQSVQLRLATSRIQREIQETTEREKELREAGKIQTMSEDTVDSKVTRIGERVIGSGTKFEKKLHKSVSAYQMGELPSSLAEEVKTVPPVTPPVVPPKPQELHSTPSFPLSRSISMSTGLGTGSSSGGTSVGGSSPLTPTQRRFTPTSGHKGLMERFLASRGKMTCISPFSNSPSTPSSSSSSSVLTHSSSNSTPSAKSAHSPIRSGSPMVKNVSNFAPVVHKPLEIMADNHQVEREEGVTTVEGMHRRGWTSAEEKIQEELKAMKIREDELRLQRAHKMAQSQPNLLSLMDEGEEDPQWNEDDSKVPSLYSTLSNPSLLDLDGDSPVREADIVQEQAGQKNTRRKKSSLIAQWENRIQQNN